MKMMRKVVNERKTERKMKRRKADKEGKPN